MPPAHGATDALPFFLAVYQGGLSEARVFRAYPDDHGISFVYAGPAVMFVNLEFVRGGRSDDWRVRASQSLKTGLVAGAGGVLIGAGLIIAILGRLMIRERRNLTDLIGMGLAGLTIAGVALIVALTSAIRRITKRVEELNAKTPDELQEEVRTDKRSFRTTAQDVENVVIDPPDRSPNQRSGAFAMLSFRHEATGKWKLSLLTRKDARAAARAFRQLLGEEEVEVNVTMKKD